MINDRTAVKDEVTFQTGKGMVDNLNMFGFFEAKLFDKFGGLKECRKVPNLVTTLGHKMAADQILAAPAVATPGWMEVGTGTGQSAGDATLLSYISESRKALDAKTRVSTVVTMSCTMGAGIGTGAITEAGIFNVVTQNTTDLICYADFAVINKGADDSLGISWTLTFG